MMRPPLSACRLLGQPLFYFARYIEAAACACDLAGFGKPAARFKPSDLTAAQAGNAAPPFGLAGFQFGYG